MLGAMVHARHDWNTPLLAIWHHRLRRAQFSITMPPLTVFVALPSEITIAPFVWCSAAASECTIPPLVVTLALPLIVTTTPSTEMLPPESILILLAPHSSWMYVAAFSSMCSASAFIEIGPAVDLMSSAFLTVVFWVASYFSSMAPFT